MWDVLMEAASLSLTVTNLFGAAAGVLIGVILGAIPGLNGTMAIALLIPVTYTWSPLFAISMLTGCWKGSIYGGSMSAVLLNTPGTPEAAATAFDGYPLACQGKAGKALQMALFASVIGSLFSDVMLVAFAPPIASFALMFGPADLAMLMVFSMVVVAGTGSESHVKGLMGATLGVLLSTVGLDPITSSRRFTFGNLELDAGVDLLAMLIGSANRASKMLRWSSLRCRLSSAARTM